LTNLSEHCIERQGGLCVVCGRTLLNNVDIHEAIVKKGDLPRKRQKAIFDEHNCVALHHGAPCHVNTKKVDRICADYLIGYYGLGAIQNWIASLSLRVLTPRTRIILQMK